MLDGMDIHRTDSLPPMTVIDRLDLPARPERKLTPPAGLAAASRQAVAVLNPDGRLWRHQSLALATLLTGQNPVVATPTASGKTLIAQLHHLHQLASDPQSATICCAPLRALSQDQFQSWRQFTIQAGQPPEHTVRIDGATPVAERADLLQTAGVIVMTPDVAHSWLLPNTELPAVRDLLERTATLFVDEAHVYDSLFGASAAHLFRRLCGAIAERRGRPPALIGATATIRDPAQHLQALTGQPFRAITEADNGAPSHPVRILHIAGQEEADLGQAVRSLLEQHPSARFLAFVDRRQGAETVAARLRHPGVAAYRSGYSAAERQRIEAELRAGQLQGLIATPALEMGIHIPELDAGLNLMLPATRKSFRQRLGRIARAKPGLFVLVAPPNALSRFGDSLAGYCQADAEPCHIYLDNPFLKHSQNHSLRQIPGQNIRLLNTAAGQSIGEITREQALRGSAARRRLPAPGPPVPGRPVANRNGRRRHPVDAHRRANRRQSRHQHHLPRAGSHPPAAPQTPERQRLRSRSHVDHRQRRPRLPTRRPVSGLPAGRNAPPPGRHHRTAAAHSRIVVPLDAPAPFAGSGAGRPFLPPRIGQNRGHRPCGRRRHHSQ